MKVTDKFRLVFLPGNYDPSKGLSYGPVCWLGVGAYARVDHPKKISQIPLLSAECRTAQELEWWGDLAKKHIDKVVRQGKRAFERDAARRRAWAEKRKNNERP
jgi:hypothetical protein